MLRTGGQDWCIGLCLLRFEYPTQLMPNACLTTLGLSSDNFLCPNRFAFTISCFFFCKLTLWHGSNKPGYNIKMAISETLSPTPFQDPNHAVACGSQSPYLPSSVCWIQILIAQCNDTITFSIWILKEIIKIWVNSNCCKLNRSRTEWLHWLTWPEIREARRVYHGLTGQTT